MRLNHGWVMLLLICSASGTFAQDRTKTIGPGTVTLTGSIVARESIKFESNTTVHVDGHALFLSAPRIEWGDNVVFDLQGTDGADGGNVAPNDRVYWCMAKDRNHWEEDWANASPPAGHRGGNGKPGESGKDVEITAQQHRFASANSKIFFRAAGGHGGRAGKGGLGGSFSLKPSGDDCDHGTNEQAHKDGPPGQDGSPGPNGDNGHIVFRSQRFVDLGRARVDGGTLIWLVPTQS